MYEISKDGLAALYLRKQMNGKHPVSAIATVVAKHPYVVEQMEYEEEKKRNAVAESVFDEYMAIAYEDAPTNEELPPLFFEFSNAKQVISGLFATLSRCEELFEKALKTRLNTYEATEFDVLAFVVGLADDALPMRTMDTNSLYLLREHCTCRKHGLWDIASAKDPEMWKCKQFAELESHHEKYFSLYPLAAVEYDLALWCQTSNKADPKLEKLRSRLPSPKFEVPNFEEWYTRLLCYFK